MGEAGDGPELGSATSGGATEERTVVGQPTGPTDIGGGLGEFSPDYEPDAMDTDEPKADSPQRPRAMPARVKKEEPGEQGGGLAEVLPPGARRALKGERGFLYSSAVRRGARASLAIMKSRRDELNSQREELRAQAARERAIELARKLEKEAEARDSTGSVTSGDATRRIKGPSTGLAYLPLLEAEDRIIPLQVPQNPDDWLSMTELIEEVWGGPEGTTSDPYWSLTTLAARQQQQAMHPVPPTHMCIEHSDN